MSEDEVKKRLREWILDRPNPGNQAVEFTDQTPLIKSGMLTSLQVVEFILVIEELREEEVDFDLLEPEMIESIDSIYANLFAEL